MKAAVAYERNAPVRVEEVVLDAPRRDEVRVRLAASGVCHSDLSAVNGTIPHALPLVLGHEGAGVIEEAGEGVSHLAPGDPVVLAWVARCGECFFCRGGMPHLCELGARINATNRMPDGSTRVHREGVDLNVFSALGTMAERAVVPAAAVVKLPADAPLDTSALLGCAVMTGAGAVFNTAKVQAGSRVAVFGAGGVGLNVIQAAAIAGAERIVGVDARQEKLDLARAFGATDAVDATRTDAVKARWPRRARAARASWSASRVPGRRSRSTPSRSRSTNGACWAAGTAAPTSVPTCRGCSRSSAAAGSSWASWSRAGIVSRRSTRPSPT